MKSPDRSAKRATLKSPVRENCTPGFVRGHPGDRVSYLDFQTNFLPTKNLSGHHTTSHYTMNTHAQHLAFGSANLLIGLPSQLRGVTRRHTAPENGSPNIRKLTKHALGSFAFLR